MRRALACWWDNLGLSCSVSAISVLGLMSTLAVCERLGLFGADRQPFGIGVAALLVGAVSVYLVHGLHTVARAMVYRDEPSLGLLLTRPGLSLAQAYALGAIQALVLGACVANAWFYFAWKSTFGLLLAVLFGYILAMWLIMCTYHWPLLAAAHAGVIPADEGRSPSLRRVFRNSLILFLASPAYSAALFVIGTLLALVVSLTGIGLVLVMPALSSLLMTQALHDHLVRLGMITPPPEGPVVDDEQWRVPKED